MKVAGADMTPEQLRAELARSQQQVADMAAAQEEFLRAVSHDLRAPLRHVTSYGTLVREVLGDLPPEWCRVLRCKRPWASSPPWTSRLGAWGS